ARFITPTTRVARAEAKSAGLSCHRFGAGAFRYRHAFLRFGQFTPIEASRGPGEVSLAPRARVSCMKPKNWLLTVAAGGLLLAASALPKRSIDTGPLQENFQVADSVAQVRAERAVLAIQAADLQRALIELKHLWADRKITPEQRRAI